MPSYYFNARFPDRLIRDERGDELASDEAALERAVETARLLLQRGRAGVWTSCVFEVTDASGEAVWTVPLARVVGIVAESA